MRMWRTNRAKGWHILYRADILFRFYGAEVWRYLQAGSMHCWHSWLQYRRECRADSRGAGWLEVSDELYSCCDSRTFHVVVFIYPLNKTRMAAINADLKERRENLQQNNS